MASAKKSAASRRNVVKAQMSRIGLPGGSRYGRQPKYMRDYTRAKRMGR